MPERKPNSKRKRGNGEGSVHKVSGKNLWRAVVSKHDAKGKRRRQVKYAKSKAEALDELRKMNAEGTQALSPYENVIVNTVLHRYLSRLEKRPTTVSSYKSVSDAYIAPRLGTLLVSKVGPEHITAVLDEMEGLSASTRCHALTVMRQAFKMAYEEGTVPINPTLGIKRPRIEDTEKVVYSPKQCAQFLSALAGKRLEPIIATAIGTGLRQGELLALRRSDIDIEAGSLVVSRTVTEIDGEFVEGPPKTKAGRRRVTLPPFTVKVLTKHLAGMSPDERVFRSTNEGIPRRQNLNRSLKVLCAKANLPILRFHDLRHTSLTLLLAAGENPRVVQERSGHTKIQTTLGIYAHVLPGMQEQSAGRLESIIESGKGHDRVE